jgi:hypothetical protein
VFTLDRFIPVPVSRRPAPSRTASWPTRRRLSSRRFRQVRAVLRALCSVGVAAVAGWMLAGGRVPTAEILVGQPSPAAVASSSGPFVHVGSSPTGAQVQIDGTGYGKTPLDLRLSPGQHTLSLQHPDALDDEQTLQVAETGATVDVGLWRRRPDVVAVRPVFPGASLLDARFLRDGQVALLDGLPAGTGAPSVSRQLWRLDPTTGQLAPVRIPDVDSSASTMVLAPNDDQVAYVTPGSSSAVTASLWPVTGSAAAAPPQTVHPESVWVAPLDAGQPPRRVFELSTAGAPATSGNPEHIVDLVWTPDGSELVAITRQPGPPARARIFLLHIRAAADADGQVGADELVLLPAEVLPDSAVPDPSGHWLALLTHAAVAPGGNDLLNLCVLQLHPGGVFRDLADLGSGAPAPTAAPIAWPPDAEKDAPDGLVFVGPAPAAASGGGGLFGIFGVLRPSAPPSGLFMVDLEASSLDDTQPRRLGATINTFGPVWRSQNSLLGFARQDDGTLALRSIDSQSGALHDLGVRLPASTAQGLARPSARWDTRHGYALLLARPSTAGTLGAGVVGSPLQAWLVSFVAPSSTVGGSH